MLRQIYAILLLGAAAFAQSQPNFSGTWKLNVAKSDFGMMPAPENRTDVIAHTADGIQDKVSAKNQQGQQDFTVNFKTDGTESANKAGERDVKMSAKWDGPVLVVTTKLDVQGTEIVIQAKWTLSEDGATLSQAAHVTTPMGEMDQKAVYEKQ
jgi:hypothetical protein